MADGHLEKRHPSFSGGFPGGELKMHFHCSRHCSRVSQIEAVHIKSGGFRKERMESYRWQDREPLRDCGESCVCLAGAIVTQSEERDCTLMRLAEENARGKASQGQART